MINAKPFKIEISDVILKDLKDRLEKTRWPDEIADAGCNYGTNLSYMKEIVDYWKSDFNWQVQENFFNSFPQYIADIDGFKIHFIYSRSQKPNPKPLIITHGWPSSFVEMVKIIPLLTANSFDVIVPSLPGFGFSDKPSKPGWNVEKTAKTWVKLMTQTLGYDRFFAEGGDLGAQITTRLGFAFPKHVAGIYTTPFASL